MANTNIQTLYKFFNFNTDVVATTNEVTSPLFNTATTVTKPWYTASNTNWTASFVSYYTDTSTSASMLWQSIWANVSGIANSSHSYIAYKTLASKLLGSSSALFSIGGTSSLPFIAGYVFPRQLFRDRLDPGNWQIDLSSSWDPVVTSTFVDDSSLNSGTYTSNGLMGYVYSGTLGTGPIPSSGGIYGLVYYDLGIVLFNATHSALRSFLSGGTTGNEVIYTSSISITGRAESKLQSTTYFCRLYNSEFNFSNNPTFVGATGNLLITGMLDNPFVYPTTIGLYNDQNELLAVAKASSPVEKSFNSEVIFSLRLDY